MILLSQPLSIVWNFDPVLFSIGSLDIRYYGLMWALAILIGAKFFDNFVRREGLPAKVSESIFIYGTLATILGARLGHCLFYDTMEYLSKPWTIITGFRDGGMASHGAAIGLLIGLWLFSRRNRLPYIWSLDRIMIPVGIGGAIEKRIIGDTCAWICDAMPESRPRHVLGIASVDDIFACVENGGDTFDCVAPARCGRNGAIFTRHGRYNIKRAQFKHDFGPLEEDCDCYTCTHYSRAYVDHALRAREFNGFTLATIHNEHFFVKLLDDIRASIDGGYFNEFRDETLAKFYENGSKG